ncbi:Helix-turn-helix domain protein [Caulifigura coniformis]|uniref:Helix-turn-helix domain protein n=1 Tax=Caulifigura coniformis TaxID=2527983 RepID=A0A517SDT6_9PLAN|nr:helix-turn-helix domain-containing protein [Caulifigura coniformis]QDT54278.1 Helix-turn-helix domain protein [Caulifigura coniformis]
MTIAEVAAKMCVDEWTVRQWLKSGELRAVNVSARPNSRRPRMRILPDDLERFIAARSTIPKPATKRQKLPVPGRWKLACGRRGGNGLDRVWK